MKLILAALAITICAYQAPAYAIPATSDEKLEIKPMNGGKIKAMNDGYIEVVNRQNVIKIFIYDKDLKLEKELRDFSVVAEIQRAYSKNHETLDLKTTGGGFVATTKDSSVQYLDIGIANRRNGSADRVSFDFPGITNAN